MRPTVVPVAFALLLACEQRGEPVSASTPCTPAACDAVAKAAQKGSSVLTRTIACCLSLVATACPPIPTPAPPQPSPSAGGMASVGGAGGSAGATAGGFGGTSATTAMTAVSSVVEFPACNPPSHKVAPIDRSKLKLGRKKGALAKKRKVSYATDPSARKVFHGPLIASAPDQRDLGACTGYAALQCRLSQPFSLFTLPNPYGERSTIADFEQLARDIYSGATKRDPWAGAWPTNDTGSNGESALKEAIYRGLFKSFVSVSTLAELQNALQSGPCIGGFDWYDGMFATTNCGQISPTGAIAGGHEVAIVGLDVDKKEFWLLNSWGNDWGVSLGKHGGYFNVTYGTMSQWLAQGGEIECPR